MGSDDREALRRLVEEEGDIATLKWLVDSDRQESATLLGEIADATNDEELRRYLIDSGYTTLRRTPSRDICRSVPATGGRDPRNEVAHATAASSGFAGRA